MARQVRKFCGCCELKIGCIIVALCRIVVTVSASVALFVIYFDDELQEKLIRRGIVPEDVGDGFYMIISVPVSILTVLFSYWFIRGATSVRFRNNLNKIVNKQSFPSQTENNQLDIERMYKYPAFQISTFFVLLYIYTFSCFLMAMLEFYLMFCSLLVISEKKKLLEECGLADAETPPPQYDSCVHNDDTRPQTSMTHFDEGKSSSTARVEPDTNPARNAGVEAATDTQPQTSLIADGESNTNVFKNAGEEMEVTVPMDPQVNILESVDNSGKNIGIEPKDNTINH